MQFLSLVPWQRCVDEKLVGEGESFRGQIFQWGEGAHFWLLGESPIKDDWVNAFAKRNKLSKTAVTNIKISCAAVYKIKSINFFDNLEVFGETGMQFLQNKKGVKLNSTVVKAISFLTTSKVFKPLHTFLFSFISSVLRPQISDQNCHTSLGS